MGNCRTSAQNLRDLRIDPAHLIHIVSLSRVALLKLRPSQLLSKLQVSRHRSAVKLENALCQVHPDHCIFHLLSSPFCGSEHHDFGTSRCRLGGRQPSIFNIFTNGLT